MVKLMFRSSAGRLADDITFGIKTVNIWSNRFSTNVHLLFGVFLNILKHRHVVCAVVALLPVLQSEVS